MGERALADGFREHYTHARGGNRLYARDYPACFDAGLLPVVCLHGLTRNSKDFEEIAPWLAGRGRRVIAIDVRGRGMSARAFDPMDYVPQKYLRDIKLQLDDLGVNRAIFLGTSMGGIIITLMAARHPSMVAGSILNDVGPEVDPAGLERIAQYAGKPVALETWEDAYAYVEIMYRPAMQEVDSALIQALVHRTFRDDNGKPCLDYDPNISAPLSKAKGAPPSWLAWIFFKWLARRPVLVLRGENSDILSEATAAKMAKTSGKITLATIPGVGHAPLLHEPASKQAIGDWLDQMP